MPQQQPATLQDVADLAKVSRGTASRALTGTGRVSAETRERVAAAARELAYATNSGARNLRHARAGSVGLWLPRGLRFLEYYMNFAFGVADGLDGRDLTVTLIPSDFSPHEVAGLHVDGFVMSDVDGSDELARAILSSGRPVVTSEAVPPGMPQPTATVAIDHGSATRLLLDRLAAGGARRIAMLAPESDQMWASEVSDAAARWASESEVELHVVRRAIAPLSTQLQSIVREVVASIPGVDAIVCVPAGLGVGVLSALRELNYAVPGDIQIVSYVDSPTLPIVEPPISALDLRPREAGSRTAQLLAGLLEDPTARTPAPTEWLEVIFHERRSTRTTKEAREGPLSS